LLQSADLDQQLAALQDAPHWYVGFSGGVDSTVLLHLLHRWCAAHPSAPPLAAIHVNHCLQSAAQDWQRHCEHICQALGVPLLSQTVDVSAAGRGEVAARAARYAAFEAQLPPGGVLFLGHHLDDQVETFFLRLMRGAGVEGLAGIPKRRALGDGLLVRPLLHCLRADIEAYATERQLEYVEDPSNADTAMDRNFLRAELLPLLGSRWPWYRQAVERASGHLASAAVTLAEVLGAPDTIHSVLGDPGLQLAPLLDNSPAVAATQLRHWLHASSYKAPASAALMEFLRQLREADDGAPVLACGSYTLRRHQDGIFLLPVWDAEPPDKSIALVPRESRAVPGVGVLSLRPCAREGLRLGAGEQLTVSWRRGGESCRLPGRAGRRDLKSVLQELHIPPWWRQRVPLVYLGDELLAIGDLLRCASGRWQTEPPPGEQLWAFHWERAASHEERPASGGFD
jgi:tRNA(Ile)-lysidine synthase